MNLRQPDFTFHALNALSPPTEVRLFSRQEDPSTLHRRAALKLLHALDLLCCHSVMQALGYKSNIGFGVALCVKSPHSYTEDFLETMRDRSQVSKNAARRDSES
eukprot:superscaffoldBa00004743_g19382